MTATEGPPMADDERRGVTVELTTPASATVAVGGAITVTVSRETWTDWFPQAEPTLTIDEVIAGLRRDGFHDVTIDQIRFWQRSGVLPAPIRRKIDSGKGKARSLYPPPAIKVIGLIVMMQRDGKRLRHIATELARLFQRDIPVEDRPSLDAVGRAMGLTSPDAALRDALTAAAERQEARVGSPIHEIEVTFTDARGRKYSHVFTPNPNGGNPSTE